jgi:Flp pilus assembly protein TadD
MCRQALTRSPDDGSLQCLLGSILLRQRRPVEAEESLRAVVNGLPDFAKGHEELANALLAQGRPGEARAHLKKVIELDADNGIAHYKLGKVLRSLGEVEQADEIDAIALRLAPTQIALARADELRQGSCWPGPMS